MIKERKYAVGGEIGNVVNFRGDYGKKRSGIVTGKKNNGYVVSTDDGNVFVESYEIDSFEEAPIAKKKRFGFFEGGGSVEEYKQAERDYDKYGEYLEDAIENENEADIKKYKKLMDEAETKMHRYERKYEGGGEIEGISVSRLKSEFKKDSEIFRGEIVTRNNNKFKIEGDKFYMKTPEKDWHIFRIIKGEMYENGGEIQSKIDKLNKVVNSKMLPESVKTKAKAEIEKLEKELHADSVLKKSESYHEESKDVYGDSFYQWHNISMDGDQDIFAYSTPKGTVIYGEDSEGEKDFSASFTTEPYYLEEAPEEDYSFNTLKESKVKAFELLKTKKLGRASKDLHESKETKSEEKVGVSKIKILWAEGDNSKFDKFPKNYSSWALANKAIIPVYEDTIGNEGYNKVKFSVIFKDGETYDGRLDVSEREDNPIKSNNVIGQHIKDYLDYMASEKSVSSEDDKKEIKEWLEKYDLGLDGKLEVKKQIAKKALAKPKFKVGETVSIIDHPKSDKTNFYKVVGHQDWNDDYGWETTIEKAGEEVTMFENLLEKSVAPRIGKVKPEGLKPKFKVGDYVSMFEDESALEVIGVNEFSDKKATYDLKSKDGKIDRRNISELKLSTVAKPKPDHKKLLAKIKAKKGEGHNDRGDLVHYKTGETERRKRSESSDKKRDALPLGKRISENGLVYYENRLNRADISKEDKFAEGGEIKSSSWGLKFLNW